VFYHSFLVAFFVFSLFLLYSKHAKLFSASSGKGAMFTEAALLGMSRLLFAAN
jgi:hypothetical protein